MAVTEKDTPSRLPICETPPSMGEILSNMDPGTSFPSYEVEKFVDRHPSKQNGLHKQVKRTNFWGRNNVSQSACTLGSLCIVNLNCEVFNSNLKLSFSHYLFTFYLI